MRDCRALRDRNGEGGFVERKIGVPFFNTGTEVIAQGVECSFLVFFELHLVPDSGAQVTVTLK